MGSPDYWGLHRPQLWTGPAQCRTLSERDKFEHSQNYDRGNILPPARTGGHRKMSGRLFGYVRVSVASDADANNLEIQRRVLAGVGRLCAGLRGRGERGLLEPAGTEPPESSRGDCVVVAALDRLGRSLTEVLETPGLAPGERRRNHQPPGVHRPRQWHGPGDAASGHRLRGDGARPGPGADAGGAGRVRATGKHIGRREGVSRKRAEEIKNMRQRDSFSWGRIATITGLPSSGIRRICTWDLEELAPKAFGKG